MPDLLFLNGAVFDGVRRREGCAVAVRDGRLLAVGEEATVRGSTGPDTEEIDIGPGLLLPGFQDAHLHPLVGGLERLRCELSSLSSVDEYVDALTRARDRQAGATWFRAGGWSVDMFGPGGPTAELLDRIVPDRPAFIPSTDHHDAWVNTRALEVAGITAATPDPPDGWIERDESGHPTGTLREAAQALVWDHVETGRGEFADAMREAQAYLHSWGITGWHDALIGGYAGLDDPTRAYLDLLDSGELTAQVTASQWWDRQRGTEQVEELVERRDRLAARGLPAGSVKLMMDGITETFTATTHEPWLDVGHCPCGDRGLPFLSAEQVREAVVALDAAGLQAHFHAIGDKAVHDALNAVEAARRANGMSDRRHQVAHLQLVAPRDRPRFRELGVVANLQGMWAHRETPATRIALQHLDEERAGWHYPFRDLLLPGTAAAGGSDWPINPPEPIGAVHVLVNRSPWSASGERPAPLVPEQAIDVEVALSAYTRGSAWVSHRHDSGELRVGDRADLVLLDRDPVTGPAAEIGAAEVVGAWALGQRVHTR